MSTTMAEMLFVAVTAFAPGFSLLSTLDQRGLLPEEGMEEPEPVEPAPTST